MNRWFLSVLMVIAAAAFGQDTTDGKRMTPELLMKLKRLGAVAVSPDGTHVVYGVSTVDLAADKSDQDLWMVPVAGGNAVQLTSAPTSEGNVQWMQTKDGARIVFTAKRDGDQAPQLYTMNPDDKSTRRLSNLASGVANLKVSPSGKHVAFTARVKLDRTVQDMYPDLPKAEARIIDDLLYRHWDEWHDYSYSHLFVAPLGDDLSVGAPIDLMMGHRAHCPLPPFGGAEQFEWSPDGKEIALTTKIAGEPATSTDSDVYLVSIEGDRALRCISTGWDGYDMDPKYSPDGKWILFHSMARPGFEADKNRVILYDRLAELHIDVTAAYDVSAHGTTFSPDSKSVIFRGEWRGTDQVFSVRIEDGELVEFTAGPHNHDLRGVLPNGGILIARQNMIRPAELFVVDTPKAEPRALTDLNGDVYAKLELPAVKERWTRTSDGSDVHSWVIYPPGFDKAKTYPMVLYCQGGPQSQVSQFFSYRWNFHLMAAKGYVVLAPNRRGLPGFGQDWNDEISGDWGGQPMRDLLACTDDMYTESYIDRKKSAAVGASFGGYSVYWMMGNHDRRFAAMISHCGCYNLESFYGSTEELWFPNWDLRGPYWASDDLKSLYDAFSPHRYVRNWSTPLLVIHGEKDFRVPVTQGMEAFTAAKVQGVPARFLYFPNEGHWVLKPQNSVLWQRVFFDWLDRYCR